MINYTVNKGDTLTAIAKRYNVSVSAITKANGIIDANQIDVGESLIIPDTTALAPVATLDEVVVTGARETAGPQLSIDLADFLKPPKLYWVLGSLAVALFLLSDSHDD